MSTIRARENCERSESEECEREKRAFTGCVRVRYDEWDLERRRGSCSPNGFDGG